MRILLCLTFLLGALSHALGNGVYMPEKAEVVMPSIPVQRALITWRDGVETLVVESSLQTESRNVGWILPVPAEPTQIQIADADMIDALSSLMQPRMIHDLTGYTKSLWLAVPFMLVIALGVILSRRWLGILITVFLALLISFLLLPSLARARGIVTEGVDVISTKHVGDYQTTVLRARDAAAVSQWLRDSGLIELADAGAETVDDYIARGWCFMVTRIAVPDSQPFAPSAMAVTFLAQRPVFPMKLTALSGDTTRVELFVASPDGVKADGFETISSDRYAMTTDSNWGYPVARAATIDLEIGNSNAVRFLWDGCVLTHLMQTMSPHEMSAKDVQMESANRVGFRKTLWTAKGRTGLAEIVLAAGILIFLALLSVTCWRRRRPGRVGAMLLITTASLTLVISLAIALFWPIEESIRIQPRSPKYAMQEVRMEREVEGLALAGLIDSSMTAEQILGETSVYQKVPVARTPHGVSLRQLRNKTYFCVFMPNGGEVRVPLPEPAAPR